MSEETSTEEAPASAEDRMRAFVAQETGEVTQEQARSDDGKFTAEPPVATEQPPAEEPAEQPPEEAEEQPAEEEVEEVTIGNLDQLAEYLEADVADLYAIKVPMTDANGERVEVSIGEWKDSYRAADQYRAREAELQQARNRANEEIQQQQQDMLNALNNARALSDALEKQVLGPYENLDWNSIRANSPAEYAAMQADYDRAKATLADSRQQAEKQMQEYVQQQQVQQQQMLADVFKREQAALYREMGWEGNEDKASAEKREIVTYLRSYGYQDQELATAMDHRALVIADKARKWDALQKKGAVEKKKVVKLGKKVLKPGARQGKAEATQQAQQAVRKRLKKSGRIDDAAAAMRGLL